MVVDDVDVDTDVDVTSLANAIELEIVRQPLAGLVIGMAAERVDRNGPDADTVQKMGRAIAIGALSTLDDDAPTDAMALALLHALSILLATKLFLEVLQ